MSACSSLLGQTACLSRADAIKWHQYIERRTSVESALLSAEHICKVYGGRAVLEDISLTVHSGEAVALVGENGCGKSTLLRILAGVTAPTKGTVRIAPHIRTGLIPDRYEKSSLTVSRFMEYMLALEKLPASAAEGYIHLLALESMKDTPLKYLSKGSLQKVAAVQALAGERDVLFVDEPLSGQDAISRRNLIEELRRRKSSGMALVMAAHEPQLVNALADRVFEIRGGLLADGAEYLQCCPAVRGVFLVEGSVTRIAERLHCDAAALSAQGPLTIIAVDVSQTDGIFRALLDGGIRIVRYDEEGMA